MLQTNTFPVRRSGKSKVNFFDEKEVTPYNNHYYARILLKIDPSRSIAICAPR